MKRLLRSGTFLGAAFLLAYCVSGSAFADDTAAATKAAGPAAPSAAAPAATPAPMASKPAMEKHHQKVMSRARLTLAQRKQVQTALNSHGAKLKVDGRFGKQSREAIKKFQSDNGLKATGWTDKATLDKLGVK